jgi:voltage-gated potassium channel
VELTRPAWREVAYARVDSALNLPLLILSVALLPLIIWPAVDSSLSGSTRHLINAIDYGIWAVFAVEYLLKLLLAPKRWRFFRSHVFELLLVVFPMLRPLRIVRSARALRLLGLARLVSAAGSGAKEARSSLSSRTATYAVLLFGLLLLVASAVVLDAERRAPGSNIQGFGDALWWGVVTISSVGYGDHYPVTAVGRAVASVVIILGLALISVMTASFAAWLVKQEEQVEDARITELTKQVAVMSAQLSTLSAHLIPAQGGAAAAEPHLPAQAAGGQETSPA